jgi:cell fate (sporulation/competence/biofilm development) regulator YlbF (YheA/YmcA/DUF963 family)
MDALMEKARELGRMLSQTYEYQALRRANRRVAEERDLNEKLDRLAEVQRGLLAAMERGETPGPELRAEYDRLLEEVQAEPAYQALVAAQENFDRLMRRVNDAIARGVEAGEQSRIILPT